MQAHEVMDVNSRTMPKKKSRGEMKTMEYGRSDNGGHAFIHRMKDDDGGYHEPETHTFGAEEGGKALAHFAKHAGLEEHMPAADPDSAAGAST